MKPIPSGLSFFQNAPMEISRFTRHSVVFGPLGGLRGMQEPFRILQGASNNALPVAAFLPCDTVGRAAVTMSGLAHLIHSYAGDYRKAMTFSGFDVGRNGFAEV